MRQTTATPRVRWLVRMVSPIAAALVVSSACTHNSTAEPSLTSSSAATGAAPTVSEVFASTLPVAGFKFYTFNIAVNGTVNVTLNSVAGAGVPPTVQLGLGIGQPAGTDCSATVNATAGTASAAPQATGTFGPGLFCVRVYDVGNLFAPASFTITIAHP